MATPSGSIRLCEHQHHFMSRDQNGTQGLRREFPFVTEAEREALFFPGRIDFGCAAACHHAYKRIPQQADGDAPALARGLVAAGLREGLDGAKPPKAFVVGEQELAAPDRAVGAVARAVERDADDGRLLVVLGHAGEDVRVVVLDLEERHAGFLALARDLEDVQEAVHVQRPGAQRRLFASDREQGSELVDLGDPVTVDDLRQARTVEHVQRLVALCAGKAARADVAGDHILFAMYFGERFNQFAADLTVGANDQNPFHLCAPDYLFRRPSSRPVWAKMARAVSSCSRLCAAESWTRTRAWPIGTTG